MAIAARGRRRGHMDYWPGFVDVLSTLLLVVTFLMSMFMIAQYFASQESSGKDSALTRLNRQIASLNELLALERARKQSADDQLSSMQTSLSAAEAEQGRLRALLAGEGDKGKSADGRITALSAQVDEQKKISSQAMAQVELLNQQIAALRRQIAALEDALNASEKRDRESQTRIADLGQRLNVALAKRVQELSRYRSDFFGELRKILGDRDDIQIVGDRFVFQAEVFFASGSAEIGPDGKAQLDKLAVALLQLDKQIPSEINWVLRIDGHTDIRPIATPSFASNWELSSARAISVVKQLMSQGVPAKRLVAAGFGEYQPLVDGSTDPDLRRNRRIELKLTER
ncbi:MULTISPECIES: peptidoglycan -binding protein [Rhodomicrobium]|uniref:peptidoglycan -binding protein n=1 Tax=Rhodomicrobium TaxID=1068 RepID=UPI000B4B3B2F|nr:MULTISPECIES: peptidoglycan -binding protein [Rhodomicrobium]